ncbi:MAG: hypothetical protein ACRDO7_11315 [Nocardioidaceae bacterium]
MNDAQTWTTIGGFLAVVVAMSTMLLRMVHTEIASLRTEIELSRTVSSAEISGLRAEAVAEISGLRAESVARFDGVERRFDTVDRRIDAVDRRIDGLDADVQVLTRRVLGIDEGQ